MDANAGSFFTKLVQRVVSAGQAQGNVCLMGEVGTGKKQTAAAVHRASSRASERFVVLNCCGVEYSTFKVDLFGKMSAEGVLTRRGAASLADKGTLYLHEVGELSKDCQAALVRFIESETFRAQDSLVALRTDVRIISSTSVSLEAAVDSNMFRSDLYHLLTPIVIHLPRLDERRDDIPMLFRSVLKDYGLSYDHPIEPAALDLLINHNFTGNMLELRNIASRVIALVGASTVSFEAMFSALNGTRLPQGEHHNLKGEATFVQKELSKVMQAIEEHRTKNDRDLQSKHDTALLGSEVSGLMEARNGVVPALKDIEDLEVEQARDNPPVKVQTTSFKKVTFSAREAEREYFKNLIRESGNNKSEAAKIAGLTLRTLYRRLKDLDIEG